MNNWKGTPTGLFYASKEIAVPIVVDTNILVPSIFAATPILNFIILGNLVPIWNHFIFQEAKRILDEMWHEWYSKKLKPEKLNEAKELLDSIHELGYSVSEMPEDWPPASLDRNDDPFLWAAVTGKAEYIISHDRRHMLRLGNFKGIPIGKPKDFFIWVKSAYPM